MTLRNAFAELTLEETQRRISQALDLLSARLSTDQGGRLRVVTDTASAPTSTYWQNQNSYSVYYATGAPTAMDAREQQALQSHINFNSVRNQRWST